VHSSKEKEYEPKQNRYLLLFIQIVNFDPENSSVLRASPKESTLRRKNKKKNKLKRNVNEDIHFLSSEDQSEQSVPNGDSSSF